MSDKMKALNDEEMETVSGGAVCAGGQYWNDGNVIYYRIATGDRLINIAQMFCTTTRAIQQLNPGVIRDLEDVIHTGDVIRVR